MITYLSLAIIVLLAWGIRIIRIELRKLEIDNIKLEKSNKEMLEANHKLTRKSKNKY